MKTVLNLTADEGMEIVKALRNVAVENGWHEDELEDCGVLMEYGAAIDAALAAMGISINFDADEVEEMVSSDEYDEDEDEDEEISLEEKYPSLAALVYDLPDGRRAIKESDADEFITELTELFEDCGFDEEVIKYMLTMAWTTFCNDFGIDVVEMDE